MNLEQEYGKVPFDPALVGRMNWDQLMGAAEQLAQSLQLAYGDGVSIQTHRAMKEAGVGPYEDQTAAPPPPMRGYSNQGEDDRITREWKERNAARQRAEFEELMRRRGSR